MELVAKGSQDVFLTGNPNTTYFRTVFKRHTNFSHESIRQFFKGELNFGKKVECIISRSGDLLTGITLEFDLPKMLGKRGKSIKWVDSIGHHLIRDVEIQIGGLPIDKHYGDWLEIWNELSLDESKRSGYNTMIGKGISISEEKTLIVPLQFWFCRNYGLALPLISLQYHEVKIILSLNDFSSCWNYDYDTFYLNKSGNNAIINSSVTDNVKTIISPNSTSFSDGQDYYYNMILMWDDGTEDRVQSRTDTQTLLLQSNSSVGDKTGYGYLIKEEPLKDYKLDDVRIYCDYIYLDTGERRYFAQTKHVYLIEQLQNNGLNEYSKGQLVSKIDLEFNHPCKEIVWINRLNFNTKLNQQFNYSDRINIAYGTNNSINDAGLALNGEDRFEKRKADYFRLMVPYQRHTRIPSNYMYVYSFSLTPEEMQPSGTCNFSRIDSAELTLNFKESMEDLTIKVYSTNYNILNIVNGMGGLAYSN